ncbi:MAG: type III pantothenate kinase [Brevinema sp.]
MIAIDIGNTNSKFVFFDQQGKILHKYSKATSDFLTPELWRRYFDSLIKKHPNFADSELRISCVNWKVFLVLRVVFGDDTEDSFDINRLFDPDLLHLCKYVPLIFEKNIPLDCSYTHGLVGTDRLLSAYAAYQKYKQSTVVASLGSATTIDLVTNQGVFYAGIIAPGLESSYKGLLNQVPHLPDINFLSQNNNKVINENVLGSLSSGLFLAHALMVEALYLKQKESIMSDDLVALLLTGGSASSISVYIQTPHLYEDNMVAYGLFLLSK